MFSGENARCFRKKFYLSDLKLALQLDLLAQNCVVVADNILSPGAPDYKSFMFSEARTPGMPLGGVAGGEAKDKPQTSEPLCDMYTDHLQEQHLFG